MLNEMKMMNFKLIRLEDKLSGEYGHLESKSQI
jgi:hypothetical protein